MESETPNPNTEWQEICFFTSSGIRLHFVRISLFFEQRVLHNNNFLAENDTMVLHGRSRNLVLILFSVAVRCVTRTQGAPVADFETLEEIGAQFESSETATAITSDNNDNYYVVGKSEPYSRTGQSDLPGAEHDGLRQKDAFIAKFSMRNRSLDWVLRTGTSLDDMATDAVVDPVGDFLYVVGETNGQLGSNPRFGQTDIFILKYDVRPEKQPVQAWPAPVVIGSDAYDSASAIAIHKHGIDLFVTGYTTGSLFGKSSGGADGFVCRIKASDGTIVAARQFGTSGDDYAQRIVMSDSLAGSLLVATETQRHIGTYSVSNMNVFKFAANDLRPLGSMLIKTFSRESFAGLVPLAKYPMQVFLAGSSWLDRHDGWQISVKSVHGHFHDLVDIGTSAIDLDELVLPQFAVKHGSVDGGDEKVTDMTAYSVSNQLVISGITTGTLSSTLSQKLSSRIFFASLDPNNGMLTHVAQEELPFQHSYSYVPGFVISNSTEKIIYATTRVNETTGALYVTINSYLIPASWKESVVAFTATPSPSVSLQPEEPTFKRSKEPFPRVALIGIITTAGVVFVTLIATFAYRHLNKRFRTVKLGPQTPNQAFP